MSRTGSRSSRSSRSHSRPLSARMLELAEPRRNDDYIHQKPSVYWVDYIEDPTPHKITNSQELYQYYNENWFTPFPNIAKLAQPSKRGPLDEDEETRPRSAYGVPLSALNYVATERIKTLAKPHEISTPPEGTNDHDQGSAKRKDVTRSPKQSNSVPAFKVQGQSSGRPSPRSRSRYEQRNNTCRV